MTFDEDNYSTIDCGDSCLVFDHGKARVNCGKCKHSFSYESDCNFTGCAFDLDEDDCLREGRYSDVTEKDLLMRLVDSVHHLEAVVSYFDVKERWDGTFVYSDMCRSISSTLFHCEQVLNAK